MRPLEIILIAILPGSLLLLSLSLSSPRRALKISANILFVLCCITLALQLLIEQPRWQLIPVYAACLLSAYVQFRPNTGQTKRLSKWCFALCLTGLSLAISVPIPTLPQPTGTYAVGTMIYRIEDARRREVFIKSNTARHREIAVQLWYPVAPTAAAIRTAPYMAPGMDATPWLKSPLFALLASHLHLVPTHAFTALPLSADKPRYPVIIFSPGLMGGRIQNTAQCEELASHGFIVVGIDHAYESAMTVFPDGHVIPTMLFFASAAEKASIRSNGFAARLGDIGLVLDTLDGLNKNDSSGFFAGRLDLQHIGIFGHSLGGATAVASCVSDKRLIAATDMDGWVRGIKPGDKPIMIMLADSNDGQSAKDFLNRCTGNHYLIKIRGSAHANFTDLPLLTPLHWVIGLSGPIDAHRCNKIVNAYLTAFFDCYLKGKRSNILNQKSSPFSEVIFDRLGNIQKV